MAKLCLNWLNFGPRYGDPVSLTGMLDAARDAGAELVGLDLATLRAFRDAGGGPDAAARELASRGLGCFELLPLHCVPDDPERTLAVAREFGTWAGALGARYVLTAAGSPADERTAELFGRCCDAVAPSGCGLAYEFFPWAPVDCFAKAHALVRAAGRENAGVLLDAWHFFRGPDGWEELESLPIEAVAYVQFTDTDAEEPEDKRVAAETRRRFPGEGCLPLDRFADTLTRRGFDGVVSIEVLSPETRALGPLEYARRSLETTRRYWK